MRFYQSMQEEKLNRQHIRRILKEDSSRYDVIVSKSRRGPGYTNDAAARANPEPVKSGQRTILRRPAKPDSHL